MAAARAPGWEQQFGAFPQECCLCRGSGGVGWRRCPHLCLCPVPAGAAGAGQGTGRRGLHLGAGPGPGLLLRPALGRRWPRADVDFLSHGVTGRVKYRSLLFAVTCLLWSSAQGHIPTRAPVLAGAGTRTRPFLVGARCCPLWVRRAQAFPRPQGPGLRCGLEAPEGPLTHTWTPGPGGPSPLSVTPGPLEGSTSLLPPRACHQPGGAWVWAQRSQPHFRASPALGTGSALLPRGRGKTVGRVGWASSPVRRSCAKARAPGTRSRGGESLLPPSCPQSRAVSC